jgi:hypothetical protein
MSGLLGRAFGAVQDTVTRAVYGAEKKVTKVAFADLYDRNMKGDEIKMAGFVGDILLVVNVASK